MESRLYGRKRNGQFDLCNPHSFNGGRARAQRLTPARRAEIAAMGFQALADKYFRGSRQDAAEWLRSAGVLTSLFGRDYARHEHPLPVADARTSGALA